MATRKEVYAAIDSERDYQNVRWPDRPPKAIENFLVYIRDYLTEAEHVVSREGGKTAYPKALANVRKIAGLAVACMEDNGAPLREFCKCSYGPIVMDGKCVDCGKQHVTAG